MAHNIALDWEITAKLGEKAVPHVAHVAVYL
jgi:hypothetical protein